MFSPADTASEAAITAAIIEMVASVAPEWQPNNTVIRVAVAQICAELNKTYPLTQDKYYSVAHLTERDPVLLLGDERADDVTSVYQNDGKRAHNNIEFAKLSDTMITLNLPSGLIDSFVTVTFKRPYSLIAPTETANQYTSNIPSQYANNYVIPRAAARVAAQIAAGNPTNSAQLTTWAQHLLDTHKIPAAPTTSSSRLQSTVRFTPN